MGLQYPQRLYQNPDPLLASSQLGSALGIAVPQLFVLVLQQCDAGCRLLGLLAYRIGLPTCDQYRMLGTSLHDQYALFIGISA